MSIFEGFFGQQVVLITKDAMDQKFPVAGRADEEAALLSDEARCF